MQIKMPYLPCYPCSKMLGPASYRAGQAVTADDDCFRVMHKSYGRMFVIGLQGAGCRPAFVHTFFGPGPGPKKSPPTTAGIFDSMFVMNGEERIMLYPRKYS